MQQEGQGASEAGGLGLAKIREGFYKIVIERYAEAINAGEEKTIPELKALVNPLDASVQALRQETVSKMDVGEYRFERDFLAYAERAFSAVQGLAKIHSEVSPSFWLAPREMLLLGAADAFDRCILLCSLLIAGGSPAAKIRVLELEGGARHPVVVFSHAERQYLLDATQESSALTHAGTLEEIFAQYTSGGRKVSKSAFEFNNEEYAEFD
ncbi:hypothetical protein HY995_03520 [Candidatus Micrarchaeota archaeon]|nr:hypothetical protein [Candidatus Micrarchaeota archaeon]